MAEDDAPFDGEEVLLDRNEVAGENLFLSMAAFDVSPNGDQETDEKIRVAADPSVARATSGPRQKAGPFPF